MAPLQDTATGERLARTALRHVLEPARILTVRRSVDLLRTASALCR
ncbi:hypothetical protein [Jiangella sp. DSM 45060]|nr:hypothetical protein [Jiangella sp. DSM 45060]SDT41168.1 hypothetical protein SAMN04515669_3937 [Jiangella sp. DSM 45060]